MLERLAADVIWVLNSLSVTRFKSKQSPSEKIVFTIESDLPFVKRPTNAICVLYCFSLSTGFVFSLLNQIN